MLSMHVEIDELMQRMEGIHQRLRNRSLFLRQVVRPRLLDEFAAAYRAAGVGVETGRLLESYTEATHPEHISVITDDRIVQGTRVPYAVFVERLLPIASRVAKNQRLFNEFRQKLGEYLVDGHTR